ncbi:MAG: hypothetical protein J6N71_04425 [Muribaculaceae bacterium]|nr:hypothetical protein [Muribaculaceae bacterium]
MKATQKQIALQKKLHPHYDNVDLTALDIKHASKLISILLKMKKNPKMTPKKRIMPWVFE